MTFGRQEEATIDGFVAPENKLINHFFHDFKGEISTAIMCVEAVRDGVGGEINDVQSSWLGRAVKNCQHMITLINNFRDMCLMEEGEYPCEPEVVDLAEAFGELEATVAPIARDREQRVSFEHNGALPRVQLRAAVFKRLLGNLYPLLLENTRHCSRLVTETWCGDGLLRIDLYWEGVVIDVALIDSVFDKIRQAEVGMQVGRGYTMLFCKRMVDCLGGEIRLKPWEGCGNKVELRIPFERPAGER